MANLEKIIEAASKLGELIDEHPAAKHLEESLSTLEKDTDAQRMVSDYNRHLQSLAEKEAGQKPIEVQDKQKLEVLQKAVIHNTVLRDFQVAQMNYVDLMRRVDEAITGKISAASKLTGNTQPAAASSPLVNPDLST